MAERSIGLGFAFDKLWELWDEEVPAGTGIESNEQPCQHIARIVGVVRHNIPTGKGTFVIGFYRDEGCNQLIAEFSSVMTDGQHEIDVVPVSDYCYIEVVNTDLVADATIALGIVGHYGNCHKI